MIAKFKITDEMAEARGQDLLDQLVNLMNANNSHSVVQKIVAMEEALGLVAALQRDVLEWNAERRKAGLPVLE
jgi:hypothetical protein